MVRDLPPRRPSATPEKPNPQGQNSGPVVNPGNVAGGSNVHRTEVTRRTGKEPILPEDPTNQNYTKGGDDQGYYKGDYFPTDAHLEVERLRQQLAEKGRITLELTRQLEEARKTQAGKPKKKKSTRRTENEMTETATVQTEVQTRNGPVTRRAARTAVETQTQAISVQVPQGLRQPPSPICHPPSPIRLPDPEQP